MRSKNLSDYPWEEIAENLEGTRALWPSYTVEMQARVIASRGVHLLRGGLAKLAEQKGQPGEGLVPGLVGIFAALENFFLLSRAMQLEPAGFDGEELEFSALLARLLQQCTSQESGDAEEFMDIEELLCHTNDTDEGTVSTKQGLVLRRNFEDGCVAKVAKVSYCMLLLLRGHCSHCSQVIVV